MFYLFCVTRQNWAINNTRVRLNEYFEFLSEHRYSGARALGKNWLRRCGSTLSSSLQCPKYDIDWHGGNQSPTSKRCSYIFKARTFFRNVPQRIRIIAVALTTFHSMCFILISSECNIYILCFIAARWAARSCSSRACQATGRRGPCPPASTSTCRSGTPPPWAREPKNVIIRVISN